MTKEEEIKAIEKEIREIRARMEHLRGEEIELMELRTKIKNGEKP